MKKQHKSQFTNNKQILYVIIIAVLVRAVWLFFLLLTGEFPIQIDTISYIENAKSFIEYGHFLYDGIRTPGYPLIISAFMYISPTHYWLFVFVLQNIANIIAVCAVYQIIVILADNSKAGFIGSSIAALNFLDIYYCNSVLTDSITQSLTIVSLLFMLMFLKETADIKTSILYIFVSSILLAYALFVRPSLLFLPFAYILGLVFVEILKKKYRSIVPTILIISILCYTPVCLWTVRNRTFVDYNGYSTVSPKNFYCFNSAAIYSQQNNMNYNETVDYLEEGKDPKLQEYIKSMNKYDAMNLRAKEIIASDIPSYMKRCIIDIAFLEFYPGVLSFENVRDSLDEDINMVKQNGFSVLFESDLLTNISQLTIIALDCLILLILFGFSIIGSVGLIKKDWKVAMLFIGTLLYHIVVCCQPVGFGAYSRFRLSFSMITIILTAYAFFVDKSNTKTKNHI